MPLLAHEQHALQGHVTPGRPVVDPAHADLINQYLLSLHPSGLKQAYAELSQAALLRLWALALDSVIQPPVGQAPVTGVQTPSARLMGVVESLPLLGQTTLTLAGSLARVSEARAAQLREHSGQEAGELAVASPDGTVIRELHLGVHTLLAACLISLTHGRRMGDLQPWVTPPGRPGELGPKQIEALAAEWMTQPPVAGSNSDEAPVAALRLGCPGCGQSDRIKNLDTSERLKPAEGRSTWGPQWLETPEVPAAWLSLTDLLFFERATLERVAKLWSHPAQVGKRRSMDEAGHRCECSRCGHDAALLGFVLPATRPGLISDFGVSLETKGGWQ